MFLKKKEFFDREIIISFFIFFLSIYIHELGHIIVAKYYNVFRSIEFNSIIPTIIYETENISINNEILIYGIIYGLVIIMMYSIYINNKYGMYGFIMAIILTICYLIGCIHDIDKIK